MRKYLLPILLIGLAYAQNPCEDERYLQLKTKTLDEMSDREYQYFLTYDEKCSQYQKSRTIVKPEELKLPTSTTNKSSISNDIFDDGFDTASKSYSGVGAWTSGFFSGLFGSLIGWGIGYGIVSGMPVYVEPTITRDLEPVDRRQFEEGFSKYVKTKRLSLFNSGAGTGMMLFLAYYSTSI